MDLANFSEIKTGEVCDIIFHIITQFIFSISNSEWNDAPDSIILFINNLTNA